MIWALCRNLVSCELVWYPSNVQNIRKSKASLPFCQRCPFRLPQPQPPPQKLSELQQLHSMEFQVGEGSGLGGQMGVLGEERADGREISSDSNPLPKTTKCLFNRKVLFLLLTVWQEFEKMLAQYWPPSVREGEGSDSLSAPSISPWDPPRTMETLHGPPIHRRRRGYDRVDQNFLRLKECLGFVQFSPGKRKMDRNISFITFVVNFKFEYFITAE